MKYVHRNSLVYFTMARSMTRNTFVLCIDIDIIIGLRIVLFINEPKRTGKNNKDNNKFIFSNNRKYTTRDSPLFYVSDSWEDKTTSHFNLPGH